ncbi:carbohydrate kinase family protein [Lysinimonas soli]|uniref:Carbohydrate kinase family protein n=1 Tax=Lysinimonas soli TaxID=1074233 RepID=A0ABW0NU88_9MICO
MSERSTVVIGDALVDELVRDDGNARREPGGSALNVAVGLSLLGVDSTLLAMVGDDPAGALLRAHLDRYRVEHRWSPAPFGTGIARSDRSDGEPRYSFNWASRHRAIRFDREVRRLLERAGTIVISGFPFDDEGQVAELLGLDRQPQGVLLIDPNPRTGLLTDRAAFVRGLESVARESELVKVSDEDLHLLYGTDLPRAVGRLLESGVRRLLVTHGAGGAELHLPGGSIRQAIVAIDGEIVDTMGAGDATFAVVCAAMIQGEPDDAEGWRTVLRTAMHHAAATIRHEGAVFRF